MDRGEWNATIIKGDRGAEVARLTNEAGQDLLIYGSGDLVDTITTDTGVVIATYSSPLSSVQVA